MKAFYALLEDLARRTGGPFSFRENLAPRWPRRGVYFFYEPDEHRTHSGDGLRVVRVGTHALREGSKTRLWTRLSQHRGGLKGAGNHRTSIFRLLVGAALLRKSDLEIPTWGLGSSADQNVRTNEIAHERAVSDYIGRMSFLVLDIPDEPGPASARGVIERNSIALLSNFRRGVLDPASDTWLGGACPRERVQLSGLWNNNHVDEDYDPAFLDTFADLVAGHIA